MCVNLILVINVFSTGKKKGMLEDHRLIKSLPPANVNSLSREDVDRRYFSQLAITKELEKKLEKSKQSIAKLEDDLKSYKDLNRFRTMHVKSLEEELQRAKTTIDELKEKCTDGL
jgi:septal ring factor EnvC (AmiA/AmiB activator)